MSGEQQRAHEIADELRGTAKNLHDVTSDAERGDYTLLSWLDTLVKECSTCGWWCDADELDEDDNCEDCVDE